LMSHSAIAQVYDAGLTADRRPYFSMEFIDGVAITSYCDTHRLDLRARLNCSGRSAPACSTRTARPCCTGT
ncbi:MAG: hypothetical protein IPH86_12445, partial [bacterium]|nr:hypothetical protein [bacterium]